VVASRARYAEGVDQDRELFAIADRPGSRTAPSRSRARSASIRQPSSRTALFGDLVDQLTFREPYLATHAVLHSVGTATALDRLLTAE